MTLEIGLVLFIVLVMIMALIKEIARPDMVVFFALVMLLMLGILTPEEALRGFSNEGMLTIALLFIVAGAVQQSGLLNQWINRVLGNSQHPRITLLRMMVPVTAISAFMNNTPIVVMLMGHIRQWCERHDISPSKFLLPLSYASIFGGVLTLIGTSTNLVVHGLMLESGMSGFTMFQFTMVTLPIACLGILLMATLGYKLLPERQTLEEEFSKESKEYLAEMVVEQGSPIVGKSIEQAGLRNLTGLFLIEIVRQDRRVSPVPFYEEIEAGDRLIFTGMVSTIVELQRIEGLRLETGSDLRLEDLRNEGTELIEAVVSHHSSLVQKSIKQSNFRSKYDAAVVAVHRNQERIKGKIGEVVLKPGDTLLLLVGPDFKKRGAGSSDFYVTTPIASPKLPNPLKARVTLSIFVGMILLASLGIMSMFKAALFAVSLLILGKVISPEEAKKQIHFQVLLLIASSFGIGLAIEKTGAATWLAVELLQLVGSHSPLIMLAVVYLLTNLFTELISNAAAAVLMFPIAVALAEQLAVDPLPYIIALTIAASASFMTPIGYQTNLLVYGPGGYRFSDYMIVGAPITMIYMLVTILMVNMLWLG